MLALAAATPTINSPAPRAVAPPLAPMHPPSGYQQPHGAVAPPSTCHAAPSLPSQNPIHLIHPVSTPIFSSPRTPRRVAKHRSGEQFQSRGHRHTLTKPMRLFPSNVDQPLTATSLAAGQAL